ncbi:hypothetical protein ACWGBY_34245 [Streptomyces griseus]|uniref:hypothetical protein n=1 Tax=Streptomyces griseus TaxID=1911 RepID=UPI0037B1B7AB|nr:hypothetical protein OH733_34810 [Streptomyces griseus]WTD65769.1 hypothetical protein OH763_02180 [Streptomyces griseus]
MLRFVRWVLHQSQLADRFAAGPRLTVADDVHEREGAPDALLENPEEATDPAAAERAVTAARTGVGGDPGAVSVSSALAEVALEGPSEVHRAACGIVDGLRGQARPDELEDAKEHFVAEARRALRADDGPEPDGTARPAVF